MYQTVLKRVKGSMAADVNGKKLEFVGNWPSEAGDSVWTDGKVIFGHIAPKEDSVPVFSNNGIPISCEKEGDELKGYFTPTGTWKKYAVAPEDWIVNNEKLFYGGSLMYNDARVMDVEVTDEGDMYIATEGTFQFSTTMEYYDAIWKDADGNIITEEDTNFIIEDYYRVWGEPVNMFGERKIISTTYKEAASSKAEKVILGNPDAESFSVPIRIYKNGILQEEIDLEQYIERIRSRFYIMWLDLLLKGDVYLKNKIFTNPPEYNSWLYLDEEHSQENMSILKVEAFKMYKDGNWEALISAAMFGYCFPGYTKKYVGRSHITHVTLGGNARFVIDITNPSMGWVVDEDGESETVEKTYPMNREQEIWIPTLISTYALLKITSETKTFVDIVYQKSHGGTSFVVNEETINEGKFKTEIDLTISEPSSEKNFTFGIDENYEMVFEDKKISIREKETGQLIETDLKLDIGQFAELIYPYEILNLDNDRWPGTKYMPKKRYRITDKDGETEIDYHPKKGYEWLDGHYSHIDEKDDEGKEEKLDDGLYRFNPCILKLKNDKYLFGIHGGKLYIKTASGIQEVGDGLKNFRLAELKNMAKSKSNSKK